MILDLSAPWSCRPGAIRVQDHDWQTASVSELVPALGLHLFQLDGDLAPSLGVVGGFLSLLHLGQLLRELRFLHDWPEEATGVSQRARTELVHALGHGPPGIVELAVTVVVHRAERLMHLDEF